ncbi:MAG: anaerobic ribonucleoside-triphosphate reductase activating protein [Bacillota bacterium]
MEIRIAGIVKESVVDGPGIRSVVFAQGCPRVCPGCHNPEALDPTGGKLTTVEEIVRELAGLRLVRGVTFSGGDPFMQPEAFAALGKAVKELGYDIVTYTGYVWDELLEMGRNQPAVMELVAVSDFIVDGPFIEEQKDLNLPFRGSRNQRIINVARSLEKGEVTETD